MALDKLGKKTAPVRATTTARTKPTKAEQAGSPRATTTSTRDARTSADTLRGWDTTAPTVTPASDLAAPRSARDGAVVRTLEAKVDAGRRMVGDELLGGSTSFDTADGGAGSHTLAAGRPTGKLRRRPLEQVQPSGGDKPGAEEPGGGVGGTSGSGKQGRSSALAKQQKALGDAFTPNATEADRERAAKYFAKHDTYIDPTTKIVYEANLDPRTGELVLTRSDVQVHPDEVPGGADPSAQPDLDAPAAPIDAAGPKGTGGKAGGSSDEGGSSTGAPTPPTSPGTFAQSPNAGASLEDIDRNLDVAAVIDARTGARMTADEAMDAGVSTGQALVELRTADGVGPASVLFTRTRDVDAPAAPEAQSDEDDAGDAHEVDGVSVEMDEQIVIKLDGERETSRRFTVSRDDGGNLVVTENIATDPDGRVIVGSVARNGSTVGPDGSTTTFSNTEHHGRDGHLIGRDQRTVTITPDGAITKVTGDATFVEAEPTGTSVHVEYTFGPVTATEVTTTDYDDGVPASATIEQHAVDTSDGEGFFGRGTQDESATIHVTYGVNGEVTGVEGADEERGRSDLTNMIADHPTANGETFAFSQVRFEPDEHDGAQTPGLVTGPGILVHLAGDVEIFQEGGIAGQSGAKAEQIEDVRRYVAATPAKMLEDLKQIDLFEGGNPEDAWVAEFYEIEGFTSAATAGDGIITFYNGIAEQGTFFHEIGHHSGDDGGAPDEDAWKAAMEADQRNGDKGISSYADEVFDNTGNENEDWAESVQLWLESRANGSITVTLPDGSTVTGTFEDLFPARAKLLEEHYG